MQVVEHLFIDFHGLGGVQSVLRKHFDEDSNFDWNSTFTIYLERAASEPRLRFLGLGRWATIAAARRRFMACREGYAPSVAIYHIPWALNYFADLDKGRRRFLIIHGYIPTLLEEIAPLQPLLDGVICVNPPLQALVRRAFAEMDPDRVGIAPYPVAPPNLGQRAARQDKQPLVLGFCGRLSFDQKRVDRIPELCRQLQQRELPFRLEFLGSGPAESWLKARLSDSGFYHFHGPQTANRYWEILSGWDAIIFTSDFEGTPIALLEALSVGVVPVYPKIGSGADAYVETISPGLIYPPGDMIRMAEAIERLAHTTGDVREEFRQRQKQLIQPHLGNGYMESVTRFINEQSQAPSRSVAPKRRRRPHDHVPFSILGKLTRLRRSKLRSTS